MSEMTETGLMIDMTSWNGNETLGMPPTVWESDMPSKMLLRVRED
jgi:hypothetical protein